MINEFKNEVIQNVKGLKEDLQFKQLSIDWVEASAPHKYSYNFSWLGRPIIQYPQDIVALQELIYQIKPDLIIETGIAHGGSVIFSASMLAMLEYEDAVNNNIALDPASPKRKVLGIDIDIREHNKREIEASSMISRIEMIEGSSISESTIEKVRSFAQPFKKVLLILDSNHTHEHVLSELNAYSDLVTVGSYCVVMDTIIQDMPDNMFADRPWNKTNNPKTAVREFLRSNDNFDVDRDLESKLQITVAPEGYLKRGR